MAAAQLYLRLVYDDAGTPRDGPLLGPFPATTSVVFGSDEIELVYGDGVRYPITLAYNVAESWRIVRSSDVVALDRYTDDADIPSLYAADWPSIRVQVGNATGED